MMLRVIRVNSGKKFNSVQTLEKLLFTLTGYAGAIMRTNHTLIFL